MGMVNGRIPIKVTAAKFITADPVSVAGFLLTNSAGAAAVSNCTIQDGNNNDIADLNTTATNGVGQLFFPVPLVFTGLSVTGLTGSGAVLYIYLSDI